jgi:fucose permease
VLGLCCIAAKAFCSRNFGLLMAPPRRVARTPVIWFAYALPTAFTFIINLIGPLLPHLRAELSLGYAQAAFHTSAFAAGMIATGLVGDRIASLFGRRKSVWLGVVGLAAGLTLVGLAPALWVSILGCSIMGALGTLTLVVAPALLAETDPQTRGLAFAEQNVIAYVGALVAPPALWLVAETVGWRGVMVLGWLTVLLCGILFRTVRLPQAPASDRAEDASLPLAYWAFWALLMITVASEFSVSVWGPSYLETVLGLSRGSAMLAVAAFPMGMVAGRAAGVVLLGRHPPQMLAMPSIGLAFVGFMVFWQGGSPWTGLAGLFVTGLGLANLYPVGIAMAISVAGPATAKAAARASLGSGLAIIGAPMALGAIADRFGMVLAYGVVPVLLACAVMAFSAGRGPLVRLSAAR